MGKNKIPQETLVAIGKRLLEFRDEKGFTQDVMAEILEISKTHYALAEKGKNSLSLSRFLMLADGYNVDLSYLLTGKQRPQTIVSDIIGDCPPEKVFDMEQLLRYAGNLYR